MAIHLDPRRLGLLKQLAGEANARPGELVTRWIEERLDAERSRVPVASASAAAPSSDVLQALTRRVDGLAQRLDELASERQAPAATPRGDGARPAATPATPATTERATTEQADTAQEPKRRGRPQKNAARPSRVAAKGGSARVPLHDEIIAVVGEGGPMTAAQIAQAVVERGRYSAPRSGKPLDAAMVNGRVSNPTYRSRFHRQNGKIGLAS